MKKILCTCLLGTLLTSTIQLNANALEKSSYNNISEKIPAHISVPLSKKGTSLSDSTKVIIDKKEILKYASEHNIANPNNIDKIELISATLPDNPPPITKLPSQNNNVQSITSPNTLSYSAGTYYPTSINSIDYIDTSLPIRASSTGLGGTYTMSITDSLAVKIYGDYEITAEVLKAKSGIETTSTRTISDSRTISLQSNQYADITAYSYDRKYTYSIMKSGWLWDSKIGAGYTIYPIGIYFVVVYHTMPW